MCKDQFQKFLDHFEFNGNFSLRLIGYIENAL